MFGRIPALKSGIDVGKDKTREDKEQRHAVVKRNRRKRDMKIAFGVRREDKRRRKKTKPGQRRQFFALPHRCPRRFVLSLYCEAYWGELT